MTWTGCVLEFRQLTLNYNRQAGGTNGHHKGGNIIYQNFDLTRAGRDRWDIIHPWTNLPQTNDCKYF